MQTITRFVVLLLALTAVCYGQTVIPVPPNTASVTVTFTPATQPVPVVLPGYSLSLPAQDAAGWTILSPSIDTRTVYVSSSTGNDANDGLSPAKPKKTINAAKNQLRDGFPDWLLLKSGDVWSEAMGGWNVSGRSRSEPMIVTSYAAAPGTPRPQLKTGKNNGFARLGLSRVDHLSVVDIDFYCDARDPSSPTYDATVTDPQGVYWITDGGDISFEGCRFRFYVFNMTFTTLHGGDLHDVRIRRCQDLDAYAVTPFYAQGMFTANVTDLLVEQSTFDHNGWYDGVAIPGTGFYDQRHNVYNKYVTRGTWRDNLISRASNYGLTVSGNATETPNTSILITNNLFINNGNDQVFGADAANLAQGVVLSGNVYTETGHTISGVPQSTSVTVGSASNFTATGNLWFNKPDLGPGFEFVLQNKAQTNISVTGNTVFNWGGEGMVNNANPATNVVLTGNDINLAANLYIDATRTVGTYNKLRQGGVGTSTAFILTSRQQTKSAWNPNNTPSAVISWLKSGFTRR